MNEASQQPVLAAKHIGMKVNHSGMLAQASKATRRHREDFHAFMLDELCRNLQELGSRYYAGDVKAVDEFLQLYCVEQQARAAIAKATGCEA